jgi:predicted transcriptional regulator
MDQVMTITAPSRLSKSRIEEIAAESAALLGYEPGTDLVGLVRSWGHSVTVADIHDHPESLVITADGFLNIFLPEHTSPARDRFTVAHEIGHFILHHRPVDHDVRYNRSGTDQAEVEANWFAGAFLMPMDQFSAAWGEFPPHFVASKFGVSLAAANVRAKSLGLA